MLKTLSNLLIYISIFFVGLYLWKNGIYKLPNVVNPYFLLLSFVLLLLGQFLYLYMWYLMLKREYSLNPQIIFESESVTIFNKYIPGKIWVIIGPVSYLKKYYDVSTKAITHYSLYLQIIIIWSGLLSGLFFLKLLDFKLQVLYILLFVVLTLLIYTKWLHKVVEKFILLVFKKKIVIPTININHNIKPILVSMLMWFIWSIAFYLMILSTTDQSIPFSVAFIFPIASVIGIVSLFSPGGLGIREGIMAFLLIAMGLPFELSTQISIDSRLWFIIFEILVFLLSLLSIVLRKKNMENLL